MLFRSVIVEHKFIIFCVKLINLFYLFYEGDTKGKHALPLMTVSDKCEGNSLTLIAFYDKIMLSSGRDIILVYMKVIFRVEGIDFRLDDKR